MKNLQKMLHKEFVQLGRERNRITYKLLALLPKINELKIYEREGYANIYDYAARIAGLSPGVVKKALKLEEKLYDMPHLQKMVETQGVNKVGIVIGLATRENEKDLAEKVEHMSKPALQEYSKELRGKVTSSWQVELDEKMMFMLLKLKKKFGQNLSNKECLRKILESMQGEAGETKQISKITEKKTTKNCHPRESGDLLPQIPACAGMTNTRSAQISKKNPKKSKPQTQVKNQPKIPGEKVLPRPGAQKKQVEIPAYAGMTDGAGVTNYSRKKQGMQKPKIQKITHYIPVHKKINLSEQCIHPGCHRPAEVIHHPDRFSEHHNHKNLRPLCKLHHEFAHNGISEPMQPADHKYRQYRQAALL